MRPEFGVFELFNENTMAREELLLETLKNLRWQGFDPSFDLPAGTPAPVKVAHIVYGDIPGTGDLAFAIDHIFMF